jgi:hypothetical protein
VADAGVALAAPERQQPLEDDARRCHGAENVCKNA